MLEYIDHFKFLIAFFSLTVSQSDQRLVWNWIYFAAAVVVVVCFFTHRHAYLHPFFCNAKWRAHHDLAKKVCIHSTFSCRNIDRCQIVQMIIPIFFFQIDREFSSSKQKCFASFFIFIFRLILRLNNKIFASISLMQFEAVYSYNCFIISCLHISFSINNIIFSPKLENKRRNNQNSLHWHVMLNDHFVQKSYEFPPENTNCYHHSHSHLIQFGCSSLGKRERDIYIYIQKKVIQLRHGHTLNWDTLYLRHSQIIYYFIMIWFPESIICLIECPDFSPFPFCTVRLLTMLKIIN